jgi:hypothetical protein
MSDADSMKVQDDDVDDEILAMQAWYEVEQMAVAALRTRSRLLTAPSRCRGCAEPLLRGDLLARRA